MRLIADRRTLVLSGFVAVTIATGLVVVAGSPRGFRGTGGTTRTPPAFGSGNVVARREGRDIVVVQQTAAGWIELGRTPAPIRTDGGVEDPNAPGGSTIAALVCEDDAGASRSYAFGSLGPGPRYRGPSAEVRVELDGVFLVAIDPGAVPSDVWLSTPDGRAVGLRPAAFTRARAMLEPGRADCAVAG